MTKDEEKYLIMRLKEGDIRALEVIFKKYFGSLCRYLSLLFKNQIVVEHIAQDIFTYIWENREKLKINNSLESYIYSAGRYKALNQIRNQKRRSELNKKIALATPTSSHDFTEIEINEINNIIEEAIHSLPERCQQIFILSRENDLSYKEIAEHLGISINTVENQMSIALKKLRKSLRPFYFQIFFCL